MKIEKLEKIDRIFVSVEEAARALGLGKTKTYELLGQGLIKSITVGKRRLVLVSSLVDFAK